MRILLTVHQFLPRYFSGTEILTYEYACELRRRGHEVHILAAEPAAPEVARTQPFSDDQVDGLPVQRFHHHPAVGENPGYDDYRNEAVLRHVHEYARKLKPDIVHLLHCHRLSAAVLEAVAALGIPRIFTATDFWFICPVTQLKRHDQSLCRGPTWSGVSCLRCCVAQSQPADIRRAIARRSDVALGLFTLRHRFFPVHEDLRLHLLKAMLDRRGYLRRQLNQVQRIFVATDLMRRILVENHIRPGLIRKLPFGINAASTRPFASKAPAPGRRIGYIGTLYEHKGAHVLIKAFKVLRQRRGATLRLYGDLSHFPEYARYLRELAGDDPDIIFAGTFPNEQVGQVLQDLDVLVVPSIWYENSPLIVLHALDTKTPVVASNVGGLAELVAHQRNGLLFERGDHAGLAALLQEVIDDADLLPRLRSDIGPVATIAESVTEIEKTYYEFARPAAGER